MVHQQRLGGTRTRWGHDYDTSVAQCHAVFAECGVPSVTGADELVGLTLVDTVGHIDLECEGKVFAAYKVWLDKALAWMLASTSSPAATTTAVAASQLHGLRRQFQPQELRRPQSPRRQFCREMEMQHQP